VAATSTNVSLLPHLFVSRICVCSDVSCMLPECSLILSTSHGVLCASTTATLLLPRPSSSKVTNMYVPFAWSRNRDLERTFQSNIGDRSHELGTCRSLAGKEGTYELTAFCASQPWVLSTRIAVFRSSCVKFWNCVMAAFCCELYTAGILC
jgi:hypothetical protein